VGARERKKRGKKREEVSKRRKKTDRESAIITSMGVGP
jgi:hypothetical protein